MLKFDHFLCCFALTTGGIVIGWINLIACAIFLLFDLGGIIFIAVQGCEGFQKFFGEDKMTMDDREACGITVGGKYLKSISDFYLIVQFSPCFAVILTIMVIAAILGVLILISSFLLIKGTETVRNYHIFVIKSSFCETYINSATTARSSHSWYLPASSPFFRSSRFSHSIPAASLLAFSMDSSTDTFSFVFTRFMRCSKTKKKEACRDMAMQKFEIVTREKRHLFFSFFSQYFYRFKHIL